MKVKIIEQEVVFDNFFKIEKAKIQYEKFNGEWSEIVTRMTFERGDSVAAIVFNTDTSNAILVNQFKYPCYRNGPGWITEVVAGMIDNGESDDEAIKREVLEEIGYKTKYVEKISSFFVSPGGSSERIILFYIEVDNGGKISNGGGLNDENEDIKILEININDLKKELEANLIQDAKTIIACNYLLNKNYKKLT